MGSAFCADSQIMMAELMPPATQHQRLRLTASTRYTTPRITATTSAMDIARNAAMRASVI